ncbi:hypothetical protein L915_03019 [Phytophthora nicotianae]|uniref:Uncharacterized protein n=2 Tax=Phytophthora nicotianae TaxID=4792 RepID=W2HF13_PHYNI|nr:hypothetical protein L915_03019 [Phytophthora nicotianae]
MGAKKKAKYGVVWLRTEVLSGGQRGQTLEGKTVVAE